jgi:hypothetical protein
MSTISAGRFQLMFPPFKEQLHPTSLLYALQVN